MKCEFVVCFLLQEWEQNPFQFWCCLLCSALPDENWKCRKVSIFFQVLTQACHTHPLPASPSIDNWKLEIEIFKSFIFSSNLSTTCSPLSKRKWRNRKTIEIEFTFCPLMQMHKVFLKQFTAYILENQFPSVILLQSFCWVGQNSAKTWDYSWGVILHQCC